ncbi:MAG TPA: TetR/AcrR family transcriptional regulator [Pseudonocardia sp.]|nr:TetR/AcrR family transcriptional regulator [Pseudonocardia sp.]
MPGGGGGDGVRTASRGTRAADRSRNRQPIPDEVIDAARRNFLRYGVNRTTMADIARAVGTPRQTLYEYVSSRDEVVDAVLVQRIREIAEDLTPSGDESTSFTEAFVETSAAAIMRAREDHELMNIVATGPIDRVQDVVTGPHAEVHDIVAHLLAPILDRGLQTGQLRTDKTRDDIIDWVRIVYLSLISQTSIPPDKVSDLVAGFLLPAIMFDAGHERRS